MVRIKVKLSDFSSFVKILIANKQWPSADGQIHNIADMSVSHIINAIAKIKREQWRLIYLPILQKELQTRIDDAEFKLKSLKTNIGDLLC